MTRIHTAHSGAAAGPASTGNMDFDVDVRMRGEWRRLSVQCPQRAYKTCRNVDR